MPKAGAASKFRLLPSVEDVVNRDWAGELLGRFPRQLVVDAVRQILGGMRQQEEERTPAEVQRQIDELDRQVARRLETMARPLLRAVINATGVVLHTNLGRAPLSTAALEAIRETAGCYCNLEYDLAAGARGKRDAHAAGLLERLLGAPAIVVNNNAAAMFLILNELAGDGEVIVSRGELIEIGDGFRIPDILARSGARLREVGTTNRTSIEDYRSARSSSTRALLRVHHSNFRIVGFTSRPTLAQMVDLGRQLGVPVVEDLGSGCLVDLGQFGMEEEPTVQSSLKAGVEVVAFSGDKLLGGPQAGIVAGKQEWISRIRRNPLFRALRVDKLTYAALGATLRDYWMGNLSAIPVLNMLSMTQARIRERAGRVLSRLAGAGELVEGRSVAGGGSTPEVELPTTLIALAAPDGVSITVLEQRLRNSSTPVITRVEKDRLLLDLRTVLEEQEPALIEMVKGALAGR